MNRTVLATSLLLVGGLAFSPAAKAGYILDLTQVGGNVTADGSGTLDLTGLTFVATAGPSSGFLDASLAAAATGAAGSTPDTYTGFTGPTSFGTGDFFAPNSGSGDYVGIIGSALGDTPPEIAVPMGYVSGDSLSSSAVFDDESLASLGVTPGTYTWTWDTPDDSFTIVASTVPEPASLALFASGLIGFAARRRKRKAA